MRALPILLLSAALGCASSGGVSSFRDGTEPGTPWQLIGAGFAAESDEFVVDPIRGSSIRRLFVVLLSNVSHHEQYLDSVSVYPIGGRKGRGLAAHARTRVERMVEEDEDVEVALTMDATLPIETAGRSGRLDRRMKLGILATMRDGTKYNWIVEIRTP